MIGNAGTFKRGMTPWNKGKRCTGMGMVGKKHSEETKLRISLAKKGIKRPPMTEEHKRNLSIALKGKEKTEEHRRNLSLSGIGRTPWNKGLEGVSIAWNKGKVFTQMIGNKNAVKHGLSHTIEYRRSMRNKRGGKPSIKTVQMTYEDNIKNYGTLTCYLCLNQIDFGKDHLEHRTPLSRGGTNDYHNLAVACEKCNRKKFTKTEEEYRKGMRQ